MSNTGITLVDVRNEAFDAIRRLKNKEMDVKTASEVRSLLNTVIDTAKTQVAFINALPENIKENLTEDNVKAIAGTLRDRDAELDETLTDIENKQNKYE